MVWSQVSIKIPRANFGNTVLDNSNLDKISHSLAKTDLYLGQSVTFFFIKKKKKKKKNCKSRPPIQTLVYKSNIYYSKIDQKGN